MDIIDAVFHMDHGYAVKRQYWNDYAIKSNDDNKIVWFHINTEKHVNKEPLYWIPSVNDLIATDYEIIRGV